MQKTLVLAEKPSVGRDLARVLGCSSKGNGYYEGREYIVTWALGHLVTLAEPEDYDKKYKSWCMDDLPILPSRPKLVVIKQSGRQFSLVKEQMQRKDVGRIVIATDAGREGELVARWIIEKAGVKKPIMRLWISSVTDRAIKEGFNNLRNGRDYENLYASAFARAEADWLVGINATRALTCKYNAQLSCGRVQTPTLAIIAQREREIQDFVPKPYYGITAVADKFRLSWQDGGSGSCRTFDMQARDRALERMQGKDAIVLQVDKTLKKSSAPLLYDLTELQRDANRIFGYSAKETLSIMQDLYERHKVLTYPRTDSRYISTDMVGTLKDRIKACGVGPYSKAAAAVLKGPITEKLRFVDNAKVSDHHAIIPTEQPVYLEDFNERERKVYDLVVKRFLAAFYPPFEYYRLAVKAQAGDQMLVARGTAVVNKGWREVYQYHPEEEDNDGEVPEQVLPDIKKGDTIRILGLEKTEGKTKPPARFNEGTLLSAMENPAKYMAGESKDLIKTIGETGGLGTVATRADIIEKLYSTFLIEKKGREIHITSKGKQLLDLVPEDLKSPALTAEWEQKLGAIARGEVKKEDFIKQMKDYARVVVREIISSSAEFRHDNITRNKCPECGKYMLEVKGKKGRMLVCQDRECGHRIAVARATNARCPECHKRLELRGEGEGQIFVCSCGFREKLSAFKERRSKENDRVSRKEVQNFMKEQKKEKDKPLNTALADALSKFKL
jgi:DNA topoisomerase-3